MVLALALERFRGGVVTVRVAAKDMSLWNEKPFEISLQRPLPHREASAGPSLT